MSDSIDPQTQTMIDNMPEKTGKSLPEWYKVLDAAAGEKHGEIMKLLKGEYAVTHGYANTISILYRQSLEGGPPKEADLVESQYSGAKEGLMPIYKKILAAAQDFGPDVVIAPKKNYVSLRRSKQFAIVQPSTKTRVDLGLILKGVKPTERLDGGNAFGGMCTHKVQLFSEADVDDEVISWLDEAYQRA